MKRFTQFPITLYRLQNSLRFKLKEKSIELDKGKSTYDYIANDRLLYTPRNLTDTQVTKFEPNGVQLYSMSDNFKYVILSTLKGGPRYYYVVEIPQGTPVPENTVLFQDPVQDHVYWLQTEIPCEPKDFQSKAELLLLQSKIHRKKEFRPLFFNENKKPKKDTLLDAQDSADSTTIV